jgi:hypothetical protein
MSGEILAARGDWTVIDWTGDFVMLRRAGDDLNDAEVLVIDTPTLAWLSMVAGPAALSRKRWNAGVPCDEREAAPGADGGSAPGESEATVPPDAQTSLLGEQIVPDPPKRPRRRAAGAPE